MSLNRNRQRINLIFRNCLQNEIFGAIPLVNDNGVVGMYYLKSGSRHTTENYVEVEDVLDYGGDDSQKFEIRSRISVLCNIGTDPPSHLFEISNLFQNQLTQVETIDDLPSRTGR